MNNTLVILNYNNASECIRLVREVSAYPSIQHIVLVDNASTDGSFELMNRELLPESETDTNNEKLILLQTDENKGYATGNNFGCNYAIQSLNAEVLTIANPDISFSNEALTKALQVYDSYQDAAGVAIKVNSEGRRNVIPAWRLPEYRDCLFETFTGFDRFIKKRTLYSATELNSGQILKVDVLPGSFFLVKADAFMKCKGFDEHTFLYYEENILARKIKKQKLNNYLVTSCTYTHRNSTSVDKEYSVLQKLAQAEKSREYYVKKYLKCGKWKIVLLHFGFVISNAYMGLVLRLRRQ